MQDSQLKRQAAVHALEADVAYFEARLSFTAAGPDTLYQRAQQKVYEALEQHFQTELEKLRGALRNDRSPDRSDETGARAV